MSCLLAGWACGDQVVFDMDSVVFRPTFHEQHFWFLKRTVPKGDISLVKGKFGMANQFHLKGMMNAFVVGDVTTSEAWNKAAGIRFWVRGDGSSTWGCLTLLAGDESRQRCSAVFPLSSTGWEPVELAWSDFVPEVPSSQFIDPKGPMKPSEVNVLAFGHWFYWRHFEEQTFAVDNIELVDKIPVRPQPPVTRGIGRTLAKLAAGKPVTIVCMGDSLTDKRMSANEDFCWVDELQRELSAHYRAKVTTVNVALGGTQLSQGLIMMPIWLREHPKPDLVTIEFGHNDYTDGATAELFAERMRVTIERLREATGGATDIVIMTPPPTPERWTALEDYTAALKRVAAETGVVCADLDGQIRQVGSVAKGEEAGIWAEGGHFAPAGHREVVKLMMGILAPKK